MISLPTERSDWRLLGRTVRLVLGHPTYAVLAIVVGFLAALGMSLTGNLGFVLGVLLSGTLGAGFKLGFLVVSLPFLGSQPDLLHGILLYAMAAITGAAVALIAYSLLEHDHAAGATGTRDAGVSVGVVAACSVACGPGIVAGIVGIVGVGSLSVLPFEGLEFSMLAVVVLVLSTYWLASGMRGGEIRGCPVDPERLGVSNGR